MSKSHHYHLTVEWTGNTGSGTASYRGYERSHRVVIDGKEAIQLSSDPAFRGDKTKHNPEELLLASLSSCHMLWFLHLCADRGVVVTDYVDTPLGTMEETAAGGGRFTEVVLRPMVTVDDAGSLQKLDALHVQANRYCFIANSVNFPVKHQPSAKLSQ